MTTTGGRRLLLVFTDLDGSLLDHHTYSYQDARGQLDALEEAGIPVIPATSKTREEILQLRGELGNGHPFIVENGAAVFIPEGYFESPHDGVTVRDGFWVHEMSPPRERWLVLLRELALRHPGEFDYFHRLGAAGIARMTGLSEVAAGQANRREYSEPVKWLGDEAGRLAFIAELANRGATVLQGGRFISVAGDCDKGRALRWLQKAYEAQPGVAGTRTLAIGDSLNDCAMLEAADTALVVRSPVHPFPPLSRSEGVIYSSECGPAGWAEGVARWLRAGTD